MVTTTIHLLRHGEVHNPQGILYGRADGYHLSERGRQMAQRVADRVGERDITYLSHRPSSGPRRPPPRWRLPAG